MTEINFAEAKRAWYLRLNTAQVPESAILVGDRSRVWVLQKMMTDTEVLNEDRGLLTVVGSYRGERVVVVAFGMGAPIAAVVAHELIDLGVKRIVRLGTMIRLGETQLGDFVIATEAISRDGTSSTYRPGRQLHAADPTLTRRLLDKASVEGVAAHAGRAISVDGFYTEMMPTDLKQAHAIAELHAVYTQQGCIGLDMETAALFAIGEAMGVAVGCACLATVDGLTQAKVPNAERIHGETVLARLGLEAITEGTGS